MTGPLLSVQLLLFRNHGCDCQLAMVMGDGKGKDARRLLSRVVTRVKPLYVPYGIDGYLLEYVPGYSMYL